MELSPAGSARLNDYITASRGATRHRRGNNANIRASYVARIESRCERVRNWLRVVLKTFERIKLRGVVL